MAWRMLALACSLTCWTVITVFTAGTSAGFEPESVVAYWLFEKGDELLDSSGNGHDGNFINRHPRLLILNPRLSAYSLNSKKVINRRQTLYPC